MEKEQKTILQVYVTFIVAIILNIAPSATLQTFGALLFLVVLIAAYIYRAKAESNKESLTYNHMSYAINSFWISSLFLVIGIAAAVALADHSIIHNTIENVKSGMFLDEEQLSSLLYDYARANIFIFSLTLGPSLVYLCYRLTKGILSVQKGNKIEKLKNWF